jgi:hypothetical protein
MRCPMGGREANRAGISFHGEARFRRGKHDQEARLPESVQPFGHAEWVSKEVAYWLEHKGADTLLAVRARHDLADQRVLMIDVLAFAFVAVALALPALASL